MESRGPNRSLDERLVDERALALAPVPKDVLAAGAVRPDLRTAPRDVRFDVRPAATISIHDVIALARESDDFPGYIGTSRPSLGMY